MCHFDGRASFHLSLTHTAVKMKTSKSTSISENIAYVPVYFPVKVPSTSHRIVKANAVISVRCFGNPLWEVKSKFNTLTIIIPLIMSGNMLG